ncbi:hypothetical protein KXV51_002696 [Aspergillus fumigatus]|nr:hypothetical protein KXX40_006472 [Aspergillus fumigatus]KAH2484974.1 hypothetical protein KXV28_002068 [Aspergillus fumigatus]KAH2677703.1 hypothetical protein KXV51_002696 [Aspergillus fumigatus]KAH2837843.1 hypothetical protein KXV85_003679 [Aspergillus fumigatus]KAH3474309.1 hypothetical protein KXX05_006045 [Aspergillus fumigatus]
MSRDSFSNDFDLRRKAEQLRKWMLSQNEPADRYFTKEQPDPPVQILKLYSEAFITLREGELPAQQTVRSNLSGFISEWQQKTCRKLPDTVRKDLYNHIRNELTQKYGLETKHREKFPVTSRDLDILIRRLFEDDDHDYVHERARFQDAFSLSLFSGSGARAGAIVESSSYRDTNECLYYRDLTFNLKWDAKNMEVKYWVTISPEFLKGYRYNDEAVLPKNWIPEQEILGKNFIFYVMVTGIADKAFRGIRTTDELLDKRPPKGRESWTLEWEAHVQTLPVLRMVTTDGPHPTRGLTFSSIRHHFTSLAQRACFRHQLRIHGIRGGVANAIDPNASRAARTQALDHQNPDTFLKYQSKFKRVDVQASFWNLKPDYECLEMEESMAHHRDTNVPQRLDAAAIAQIENDDEMKEIYHRIDEITQQIGGKPAEHKELAREREKLYTKAAKKRRAKKAEFIDNWWRSSYDEYITGNEFGEQDPTCLFDIYRKYMPERARLRDNLFTKASIGK